MNPRLASLAFSFMLIALVLAGCIPRCVEEVRFTPSATADVGALTAADVKADFSISLRECCPMDPEQAKSVRNIQKEVHDLTLSALRGEVPVEDCRPRLDLAASALQRVLMVCRAKTVAELPPEYLDDVLMVVSASEAQPLSEEDRAVVLDAAWNDVRWAQTIVAGDYFGEEAVAGAEPAGMEEDIAAEEAAEEPPL